MNKKIPFFIITFFLLIILLDSIFIYIAKRSYSGVYTTNHYQKGVDFDKLNKLPIYHLKTGWKGELNYDPNHGNLEIKILDQNNDPVKLQSIEVKALRTVTDKYDFSIAVKEQSPNIFTANLFFPLKGKWELRVKVKAENQTFIFSKTIVLDK
jgi:nitrogen fixation protein FixH